MVYLKAVLMSNDGISIEAPLFVAWFQCVITALICYAAGLVGERAKKLPHSYSQVDTDDGEGSSSSRSTSKPSFFAQFPKAEYSIPIAKKVFPLSVVFVGMITFNNLCLKWVEVSFYSVTMSLTIVFNVFFSRVLLGAHTSPKTLLCLAIVIIGFAMGSHGELNNHHWSLEFFPRITQRQLYKEGPRCGRR
jgi:GDP-fucose transporter C1